MGRVILRISIGGFVVVEGMSGWKRVRELARGEGCSLYRELQWI